MKFTINRSLLFLSIVFISSCSNSATNNNQSKACCSTDKNDIQNGLFAVQADKEFENIHIKKLSTDSLATSFIIWVKEKVRPHRHVYHTENIYVIEGEAEMVIEGDTSIIKAGTFLTLPMNTIHEVTKVISKEPLKVLSVQSPEFFGKDRVFVD